ncbi:MAG: cysteine-rich CWC family protein [Betaproteobacteria bacterium]
MNTAPAGRPASEPVCPLCGRPNRCAPAQSGTFQTPCWCREATFSAGLLARVPQRQRNIACICRACLEAATATTTATAPSPSPPGGRSPSSDS